MRATASHRGKTVSTESVLAKIPTPLTVPIRALDGIEGLALGFRTNMLEMGDAGGVDTGTGYGSDFIILRWGEKMAVVRGSEVLRAWVKTIDPDGAARFPASMVAL